jgi:transposase-like protein
MLRVLKRAGLDFSWLLFDSVALLTRASRTHGVNANQVFAWRWQYRQGLLERANKKSRSLLPVRG